MSIYKRGEIWWMDVRMGGSRKRVRKSIGCKDKTQARIIEQAAVAVNRGITTRARARAIVDAMTPDESLGLDEIAAWYTMTAEAEHVTPSRLEMQKRMSAVGKAVAWMKANTRAACADDVSDELAWQYACFFEKSRQGVVTVALYTGLRKRDVETLLWDDVDLAAGVMRKTPGKTARRGIRVVIPMHREVRRVLGEAADRAAAAKRLGEREGEFVFPWRATHPNGQRPKPGDHFFSEVLAKDGIAAKDGERISFHCLRHTFVTRLAEAGIAQDVRMRLAGHTNAATNDLYTHDDVSARAAIDALK